jgi:Tfp pilus assembly protein PilZ
VPVTYRAAAFEDSQGVPRVEASTRNLGAGGAFVLCDDPLPLEACVELILHLPRPARDIEVKAVVRWRVTVSDDAQDAGMGLQFVGLAVDDLLALKEYFASLTGMDTPA